MAEPSAASAKWPPLLVVGITGGIASGKSTVSRMFADLGAAYLNADDEGRAAAAPGEPALAEIVAAFGTAYLRPDGTLDRRALGNLVFSSPADRERLNRITHPRIAQRLQQRLRELQRRPPASRVVVVEAAILIEAGWHHLVDRIVVVMAQHSTQTARLMTGLGYSRSEAEARIASQLAPETRARHAHYRLSGDVSLDEARSHVAAVWSDLIRTRGHTAAPAPK